MMYFVMLAINETGRYLLMQHNCLIRGLNEHGLRAVAVWLDVLSGNLKMF